MVKTALWQSESTCDYPRQWLVLTLFLLDLETGRFALNRPKAKIEPILKVAAVDETRNREKKVSEKSELEAI